MAQRESTPNDWENTQAANAETKSDIASLDISKLPQDVDSLIALRDELGDYLSTLERNTQSITDWLNTHESKIISQHHYLMRAVAGEKNEAAAIDILANIGEAAGFILDISDFRTLAAAQFGDTSTLVQMIDIAEKGIPSYLLEDLPAVDLSRPAKKKEFVVDEIPFTPPKRSFWNKITGTQSKEEKERQRAEEERKAFEENTRAHWHAVRAELISLQSDRNYFVDSFMDWAASSILGDKTPEETEKLLYSYQDPAHVISLAQQDYDKVMQGRVESLRVKTQEYSDTAQLLDSKNVSGLIGKIDALYTGKKSTSHRELLLSDPYYKGRNFAEVALNYIENRDDQFKLFSKALTHEKLSFKDADTPEAIFQKMLAECLKAENPLNPAALSLTMKYIKAGENPARFDAYEQIYQALEHDPERFAKVMSEYRDGLSQPSVDSVTGFSLLDTALKSGDDKKIVSALKKISQSESNDFGLQVAAMWHLSKPYAGLYDSILHANAYGKADGSKAEEITPQHINRVILAHEAGLDDSLKQPAGGDIVYHRAQNLVKDAFQTLSDTSTEHVQNVRKMLHYVFAQNMKDFSKQLTRGWIEKIWESAPSTEQAVLWTGVFLEPFSNIEKCNILATAADMCMNPDIHPLLDMLEQEFASENPRLNDNAILMNTDRIASLWYKESESAIMYTIAGEIPSVLTPIADAQEAKSLLDYLARKGGFKKEYGGLFNPAHINRFIETADGSMSMGWNAPQNAALTVTSEVASELRTQPGFLHGTIDRSGEKIHLNMKSIALAEEIGGAIAIITKSGQSYKIHPDAPLNVLVQPDWVKAGNAYINPALISTAHMDEKSKQIEIRIESVYFDQLLDKDKTFYPLAGATVAEWKDVRNAFLSNETVLTYQSSEGPVFINIGASDFITYNAHSKAGDVQHGFRYHKFGAMGNSVFLKAEPDFVESLHADAHTKKRLVTIGNIATIAVDNIENIYYSERALHIQTEKSMQKVDCDDAIANEIISKVIALRPDMTQMIFNSKIANDTPVVDLLDMNKSIALKFNADTNRIVTQMTLKSPVEIVKNQSDAQALFDTIEADGLPPVRNMPSLKDALVALPSCRIVKKPALQKSPDRAHLLSIVHGGKTASKDKKPPMSRIFTIISNPVQEQNNDAAGKKPLPFPSLKKPRI